MTGIDPSQQGSPGSDGRRSSKPDVLVRHWWNRRWGRMARRDVYIRTDGVAFRLELREGGTDSGRGARRWFDELGPAVEEAGRHMAPDQEWVDITAAHTRRSHTAGEAAG
jgi:hypothetical protein